MNVKTLFKKALSLCGENNSATYLEEFALDWVNVLLAEHFETEQSLRLFHNEKPLGAPPVLVSQEEEIPYSAELVQGVLPLFAAAIIADLCDDRELAQSLRARAALAEENAAKAFEHAIPDVYSGEVSI